MSEQVIINSLEFAEKSVEIHGTIALLALPRLKEVLFSSDGELHYRLQGGVSGCGEPELVLRVEGRLELPCQRCLGPLEFMLDTSTRFVVVADEARLPAPEDDDDGVEYLVADAHLDVASLIEDEVLLSVPLAPVHEEENCSRTISAMREQKESPFKVLQGLKLNKS